MKTLFSLTLTTLFFPTLALANYGGEVGGGGNAVAAAFVKSARQILLCLEQDPKGSTAAIGITPQAFGQAVDEIGVVCASDAKSAQMLREKRDAAYDPRKGLIYLRDCGETFPSTGTLTHEYLRSLGEGNEYRYSSRMTQYLETHCGGQFESGPMI